MSAGVVRLGGQSNNYIAWGASAAKRTTNERTLETGDFIPLRIVQYITRYLHSHTLN